ncbi:unnamed protein product [Musa acuminata subsp. malaccensis]|uniref:(wild Malaysian banana) hypothetical protein n=1 Tax=Musa acuminata subsp. malaccensis TaxID=214687 RepID=A0A8D7AER3_MUSAM|nr:unnamed protein product [Musa acuminata subsp. malaccensis]
MEHNVSVWHIGLDMDLVAAAYAISLPLSSSSSSLSYTCKISRGICCTAYYVQSRVIQDKGPVFASAFSPLTMIIVGHNGASSSLLRRSTWEVVGSVLIIVGLYSNLWGKNMANKEKEWEAMDMPVHGNR